MCGIAGTFETGSAASASERCGLVRSVSGGTMTESESPRAAMSRATGVRNVETMVRAPWPLRALLVDTMVRGSFFGRSRVEDESDFSPRSFG
jgi:hypothetical protein